MIILASCSSFTNNITYLSKGPDYYKKFKQENKQLINNYYNENAVLFKNEDGTYELTMFSSPIYIRGDETYNICDNTLETSENEQYSYTNHCNDVKTYLPERLSDSCGMYLVYGAKEMTIYPQTSKSLKAAKTAYTDIFGHEAERLIFHHTFEQDIYAIYIDDFGINTEIEIKERISVLNYQLEIENVTVDQSCPDYIIFRDEKSKEVVAIIYNPVIVRRDESLLDSMTKSSFDMSIQKVDQTHYHLSIELPENLPEEAYPLRINQSFHMYKAKQPDSAVYSWSDAGYYLNDKVPIPF